MSVVANKSGNNVQVQVTEDCTDIFALAGVSNAEKKLRCLQRCEASLRASLDALQSTDAALDQRAADAAAAAAAAKAARPTGTL